MPAAHGGVEGSFRLLLTKTPPVLYIAFILQVLSSIPKSGGVILDFFWEISISSLESMRW